MAMDKTVLGKALADLVLDASAPAEMQTKIVKQWTDIAGVIIDHITTYAEVSTTVSTTVTTAVTVVPATGVGTGTGTGSGTGTGTIQ